MSKTLRDELIEKYPGIAARAQAGQRLAGIKLHCIECMGGSRTDAANCEATECFLWPLAFDRRKPTGG